MIRHAQGDELLLITQDDHARLSGRLAERIGNALFATPAPFRQVIDGIAMHDCGWPLHDDNPTLNRQGLPLHVLESPMRVTTAVWAESVRKAAEVSPYSGLLVSLHVMALSAVAKKHDALPHERDEDRHDLFLLNQFQQDQIEMQEELRRRLGMRTDVPRRLGLAKPDEEAADDLEQLLCFNYDMVKMMDRLSLDACCGEPLFSTIDSVRTRPGAKPIDIRIEHPGVGCLAIDPWPFGSDPLGMAVPCRKIKSASFANDDEFRVAYAQAPVQPFVIKLTPA